MTQIDTGQPLSAASELAMVEDLRAGFRSAVINRRDPSEAQVGATALGHNQARLAEIRGTYDRDGLFDAAAPRP